LNHIPSTGPNCWPTELLVTGRDHGSESKKQLAIPSISPVLGGELTTSRRQVPTISG